MELFDWNLFNVHTILSFQLVSHNQFNVRSFQIRNGSSDNVFATFKSLIHLQCDFFTLLPPLVWSLVCVCLIVWTTNWQYTLSHRTYGTCEMPMHECGWKGFYEFTNKITFFLLFSSLVSMNVNHSHKMELGSFVPRNNQKKSHKNRRNTLVSSCVAYQCTMWWTLRYTITDGTSPFFSSSSFFSFDRSKLCWTLHKIHTF